MEKKNNSRDGVTDPAREGHSSVKSGLTPEKISPEAGVTGTAREGHSSGRERNTSGKEGNVSGKKENVSGKRGNASEKKENASGKKGNASGRRGFTSERVSFNRKMVAASAAVTARKSTIHSLCAADVTLPRQMMREHRERTGEKLSFTAYIVYCLAQVVKEHPHLNAFRRGNRLITLDDVTVSVLVEREISGERVPEPLAIEAAQSLTFREINDQIRSARSRSESSLGGFSGMTWIHHIPGFLLKAFVRLADRNIRLAKRYGKVAVTAVGMFSREPVWFIPHGSGTVLITVGSIEKRMVFNGESHEEREFLCLTGSFNHDIVDGAPAARFMNQLLGTLKSGMGLFQFPDCLMTKE